ncbi:MAG: DUF751 domain-containing protein [Bacteroidia bacterium]|nr:DUF751 domain-containing protein [Bacteroidia bacterium]
MVTGPFGKLFAKEKTAITVVESLISIFSFFLFLLNE